MGSPVDDFINNADQWRDEFIKLREILLGSGLTEALKWGVPCYTVGNKNVALIHGFKEYCAILFVKGALLKDPCGILVQQTANVQAARQVRFTGVGQIIELEPVLKEYIAEAVEAEKAGREVDFKKNMETAVPEELQRKFDEAPAFKAAFDVLTPGRQRAYILYFTEPRQPKTRESRIEKCAPLIFEGKGLNDREKPK